MWNLRMLCDPRVLRNNNHHSFICPKFMGVIYIINYWLKIGKKAVFYANKHYVTLNITFKYFYEIFKILYALSLIDKCVWMRMCLHNAVFKSCV